MTTAEFQKLIWSYYRQHGRHDLPWRQDITPYRIVISEVMLQQTQANRVTGYFERWMERFPDWKALAEAPFSEVLEAWQGLGYNRRALWLQQLARTVAQEYDGALPEDPTELVKLPGIGPNTAGSVAAFAFNRPVVFIETNIRRVFIHHFFPKQEGIADEQLRPLIQGTLDGRRPREWYWALMDYGSSLPKVVANPNRRSRHYTVQSRFEGSVRQLRGEVLRRLLEGPRPLAALPADARVGIVLAALEQEGFVEKTGARYQLAGDRRA